jgi:prepilin-type processing-associated H-X9-DG protein
VVVFCFACVAALFIAAHFIQQQNQLAQQSSESLAAAKEIGLADIMYSTDYDDLLPNFTSSSEVAQKLEPYVRNKYVTSKASGAVWNQSLSAVPMTTLDSPADTWVCYWQDPMPGKYDVAFADGHAKYVTKEQLAVIKAKPTSISTPSTTTPPSSSP